MSVGFQPELFTAGPNYRNRCFTTAVLYGGSWGRGLSREILDSHNQNFSNTRERERESDVIFGSRPRRCLRGGWGTEVEKNILEGAYYYAIPRPSRWGLPLTSPLPRPQSPFAPPPRSFSFGFGGSTHVHYFLGLALALGEGGLPPGGTGGRREQTTRGRCTPPNPPPPRNLGP